MGGMRGCGCMFIECAFTFNLRYFTQKAASESKKKRKKEKDNRKNDFDTFSNESDTDSDMDFAG